MKKIIMLMTAAMTLSFIADAQTSPLKVYNYSACDVHFEPFGGPSGSCSVTASAGTPTTLAPGGTIAYTDPTAVPIPGLGTTDYILGAYLYNEVSGVCSGGILAYKIGELCAGVPNVVSYVTINDDCSNKCRVRALWTSGSTLEFY